MKKSFIVDLDVESDTDFLGIAEELKDSINSHFPLACLRVAPWASPTLGQPSLTLGGAQPPNENQNR